jgi:phosphopantothenoylcysteine decarboxylase
MARPLKLLEGTAVDGQARVNLILGCTGSIAAIKIPELVCLLQATNKFNIVLLPSKDALHFFNLPGSIENEKVATLDDNRDVQIFLDEDEYQYWHSRDDPVLHIELRRWADMLFVAPLSADTLAKIAGGRCDTLLLEVLRAWDYTVLPTGPPEVAHKHSHENRHFKNSEQTLLKKLVACPAMNTHMYLHPLTEKHIRILREELHFELLGPIEKKLACGDLGTGGMSEVSSIVEHLSLRADEILASRTVANANTTQQEDFKARVMAELDEDVQACRVDDAPKGKRLGWGKEEDDWARQQRAYDENNKQDKLNEPEASEFDKRLRDQLDEL